MHELGRFGYAACVRTGCGQAGDEVKQLCGAKRLAEIGDPVQVGQGAVLRVVLIPIRSQRVSESIDGSANAESTAAVMVVSRVVEIMGEIGSHCTDRPEAPTCACFRHPATAAERPGSRLRRRQT
jgi:hypothetical protein